jgi:hypothetical protein
MKLGDESSKDLGRTIGKTTIMIIFLYIIGVGSVILFDKLVVNISDQFKRNIVVFLLFISFSLFFTKILQEVLEIKYQGILLPATMAGIFALGYIVVTFSDPVVKSLFGDMIIARMSDPGSNMDCYAACDKQGGRPILAGEIDGNKLQVCIAGADKNKFVGYVRSNNCQILHSKHNPLGAVNYWCACSP